MKHVYMSVVSCQPIEMYDVYIDLQYHIYSTYFIIPAVPTQTFDICTGKWA